MKALVTKVFSFDAAHQLIAHNGQCANLHGHTYKLEVNIYSSVHNEKDTSEEGFVIDFSDLKRIVNNEIVNKMDHAFLSMGNEPVLEHIISSGSKVCVLGFRTSCENLATYICYTLNRSLEGKVYSVRLWETPSGSAEVFAKDILEGGPDYRLLGGCDFEK